MAERVKTAEPPNVEERKHAALTLARLPQQDAFQEDLGKLGQKSAKLPCNHQLYQLDPFLQSGVTTVGGRLKKASTHFELRHPIIPLKN